jgi:hypothetical protein
LNQGALVVTDGPVASHELGDMRFIQNGIIAGSSTVRPVKPVLTAFNEDLAFPVSDVGPVDNRAFF